MMRAWLALALCAAFALPAHAEQMKRFGDVEVHYNAMSTDELIPEVARKYGVQRSRNRGLATISVLQRDAQGANKPIKAKVDARIKMLTGQAVDVDLREVADGQAVYYLGDFRVAPPVTLRFEIDVRVPGKPPMRFDFSQEFFR